MTDLLERAVAKARALADDEQNTIATLILAGIEDEARWDSAFAQSQDALAKLAAEAMAEDRNAKTRNTPMEWQDVCADPLLRNLPYKIELDEWGQIIMSPVSSRHSYLAGLIQDQLRLIRRDGFFYKECPIQTSKGVRSPDVAWASEEFVRAEGPFSPLRKAPELCIEILSPSNSAAQMKEKRYLYFARSAQEVWLCDEQGVLSFYDCAGQMQQSKLFPAVERIDIKLLH